MTAQALALGSGDPTQSEQARKYLHGMVAVGRSARPGEFVIALAGTGSFFRTDRLGATAVRALIDGQSDEEVIALVERTEPGSGERARRLIFVLDVLKGAMSPTPPPRTERRWRTRRRVALAIGYLLSATGAIVRTTPTPVLTVVLRFLLALPLTYHLPKAAQDKLVGDLKAGGYTGRVLSTAGKPRRTFNYLFVYVSVCLTPDKYARLIDGVFDRKALDRAAEELRTAGPTVGVWLHGPLAGVVPNALRNRGHQVVRVVQPLTHGINLSAGSGPLRDFFGEPASSTVGGELSELLAREDPDPAKMDAHERAEVPIRMQLALLRRLRSGDNVYLALDNIVHVLDTTTGGVSKPKNVAEVAMLGRRFLRNDGPATLAVRSGCGIALWTTHVSRTGAVVLTSARVHPNTALPPSERAADVSNQLYRAAEAAILQHPEAWRYWSQIDLLTVD